MFVQSNIDDFETWFGVYKLQAKNIPLKEQLEECWRQASCQAENLKKLNEALEEKNERLEEELNSLDYQLGDKDDIINALQKRLTKIKACIED